MNYVPGESGPGSAAPPGRPGPVSVPVALDPEQHSPAHRPEPGGGAPPGLGQRQEEAALLPLGLGLLTVETAPAPGVP